jgi:MFS family permease
MCSTNARPVASAKYPAASPSGVFSASSSSDATSSRHQVKAACKSASRGLAGAALACFLVGGVAGTLLGGRIADRIGLVRALQIGTVAMVPALVALRLCPNAGIALAVAGAAGLAINISFSVMIKLGQDYLPSRPGTATGVTLGLAVSVGGLFAPVLGAIAEARASPRSSPSCASCPGSR